MQDTPPAEDASPLPEARSFALSHGSGGELFATPLAAAATAPCTAARLTRRHVAPQLRQAAFDAAPALRAFLAATPRGMLDAGGAATAAAAAAVGAALAAAVPPPPEDEASAATAEDAAARQYVLAAARAAAWDLFEVLFVARGGAEGAARGVVRWANQHAMLLSTGVPADTSKFLGPVLAHLEASGGRCEEPGLSQAMFWKLLKHQVARGAVDGARTLLSLHWLAAGDAAGDLSPQDRCLQVLLGQVEEALASMPVAGEMEGYTAARAQWLGGIQHLVRNLKSELDAQAPHVLPRAEDVTLALEVLRVLGAAAPQVGAADLAAATPSALHLFVAHLAHVYPTQGVNAQLSALLQHCQHQKRDAPAPPTHRLFCEVIVAAADTSALQLVRACADSALCGDWVAAHVAMLLERHPLFAEELAEPPSPHSDMGWSEFYLQRHVSALLATDPTQWRPALAQLAMCPAGGRDAAAAMLASTPVATLGTPLEARRLQAAGAKLGLARGAAAVAEASAMASLEQGRLAEALQATIDPLSPAGAALAQAALDLVQQHAASPRALADGDADVQALRNLLEGAADRCAERVPPPRAGGRPPAGIVCARARVAAAWAASAAYARLLAAAAALGPLDRAAALGLDASDATDARACKGAIAAAAVTIAQQAPEGLCLQLINKLSPYLDVQHAVFTPDALRALQACFVGCTSAHGVQQALPPKTLSGLRMRLFTALAAAPAAQA